MFNINKDIKFNDIDEILNHQFIGNHGDDGYAMKAIDSYCIRDDISLEDKIKASYHLEKEGMGIDKEELTKEHIIEGLKCVYEIYGKKWTYKKEEE